MKNLTVKNAMNLKKRIPRIPLKPSESCRAKNEMK